MRHPAISAAREHAVHVSSLPRRSVICSVRSSVITSTMLRLRALRESSSQWNNFIKYRETDPGEDMGVGSPNQPVHLAIASMFLSLSCSI